MKQFSMLILSVFLVLIIPFNTLLALGPIPVSEVEKKYNFNSSGIIDWNYSTVYWEKGRVILQKQGEKFISSGVLWTKDIHFNPHIYSLTLTGAYSQPSETHILAFVSFGDDLKEYPLSWGSVFTPHLIAKKMRLKIFLATSNPTLSPELNEIILKVKLKDLSENGPKNRDNKRVSDLKRMKIVLDKYYNYFGHYPIVSIKKSEKDNQWDVLESVLDSVSLHYRKNYKYGFQDQPKGVGDDYKYGYLTDKSGNNFLLWTRLEQEGSKHLENSWKGDFLNVSCSPPIFCLSSFIHYNPDPAIRFFEEEDALQGGNLQFIKEKNNKKVYLNLNGSRLWLNSPDVFENVGGVWDDVVILGSAVQKMPLVKFIRAEGSKKIYLVLKNGTIRHMLNSRMMSIYGGKFDDVIVVGQDVIKALPRNYLIRSERGDKVYLLDQKIKRWVSSPQVLKKLNFDFSDVAEVKPEELESYAEGAPIF